MSTVDGKLTEICGRQFSIVDNGLDEAEVRAFVASLVDQINDLARKLKHLNSLTKLAERTVIEAEELAKSIRVGARKKANAKATAIITGAEEKGKQIIEEAKKKAKPEARKIVSQAEQRGIQIVEEARKKAEREAKNYLAEAERRARQITKEADQKVENAKGLAREEASRIVVEAKRKAEESLLIRQEAEQLLIQSRKMAKTEIREKFKRSLEELLSNSVGTEEVATASTEEANKAPEPPGIEDTVRVQVDTKAEGTQGQTPLGQEEGDKKESLGLYHGTVELVIPPPLGLARMLKLHRHLTKTPQIKVLNVKGSKEGGLIVRLLLRTHIPLLGILEALPQVEKVSDTLEETGDIYRPRRTGDEPLVRRIVVTTKK